MRRLAQVIICCVPAMILNVGGATAETMQLIVNGQERTFLIERPAVQAPQPTIIMLHGAGGTAAGIASASGLVQLALRRGFVAVFPQGLVANRWNFYPSGKESATFLQFGQQGGGIPDDIAFLKMLVADLVRRGISDPQRFYLAGYSNGGFMTLRMICVDAGTFAAVGLLMSGMPELIGADCRPSRPVPVLMIKGTADQVVPYDGGLVGNALPVWSNERLLAFFHRLNGCDGTAQQSLAAGQPAQKIEIELWTKCTGAPVILHRIIGGGHALPATLNVGEVLADFFSDKVK
jgi:polyhydroxybutyrate depolymerase